MAKHKNKYQNKSKANQNSGAQFSGNNKKSNSSNYSAGSMSTGSMNTESRSSSLGNSGSELSRGTVLSKVKGKIGQYTPSVATVKSGLPLWGGIALGAIAVYAIYRNREKILSFINEQDFSLPSFLGGSEEVASNVGGARKGKPRLNTVATNTH